MGVNAAVSETPAPTLSKSVLICKGRGDSRAYLVVAWSVAKFSPACAASRTRPGRQCILRCSSATPPYWCLTRSQADILVTSARSAAADSVLMRPALELGAGPDEEGGQMGMVRRAAIFSAASRQCAEATQG